MVHIVLYKHIITEKTILQNPKFIKFIAYWQTDKTISTQGQLTNLLWSSQPYHMILISRLSLRQLSWNCRCSNSTWLWLSILIHIDLKIELNISFLTLETAVSACYSRLERGLIVNKKKWYSYWRNAFCYIWTGSGSFPFVCQWDHLSEVCCSCVASCFDLPVTLFVYRLNLIVVTFTVPGTSQKQSTDMLI